RISGDAWIGGSDSVQEGKWRWAYGGGAQFWEGNANGTPYYGRYSNWASGHPDDSSNDNDCAAMAAATGEWQARPCTQPLQVLCVRSRAKMRNPKQLADEDDEPRKTGCVALGTCGANND